MISSKYRSKMWAVVWYLYCQHCKNNCVHFASFFSFLGSFWSSLSEGIQGRICFTLQSLTIFSNSRFRDLGGDSEFKWLGNDKGTPLWSLTSLLLLPPSSNQTSALLLQCSHLILKFETPYYLFLKIMHFLHHHHSRHNHQRHHLTGLHVLWQWSSAY